MKNIAIIPARGGSKRIPRKNIKPFMGKPIIAYSIEAALESGLFDEVMVSTDDEEIAMVARQYGAKVPFMRSAVTANDYATMENVIEEVLKCYQEKQIYFDCFCCILSTAPFLTANTLCRSNKMFLDGSFDSLIPVLAYSYPIQRALRWQDTGLLMREPAITSVISQFSVSQIRANVSMLMCFPSLLMLAIIFVVIPAASLKSSFRISRSNSVCQSGL